MKSLPLRKVILTTALVAGLGAFSTATFAADDKSPNPGTDNRGGLFHRDSKDTRFAKDAAEGGQMEVELADMAAQKAQSSGVKQFAQKLGQDHRKANQELQTILQAQGIVPDPSKHDHNNKFAKLTGEEFDKEYVDHMVKDHQKDIEKFEKQSQKGENQALRDFAAKQLPVLRQHLTIAKALQTDRNADISGILNESAGAQPDSSLKSSSPSSSTSPSIDSSRQQQPSSGSSTSGSLDRNPSSSGSGTATTQDQLQGSDKSK